jgi:hypothetical protein
MTGKSQWYNDREFSNYLLRGRAHPRAHREQALPRGTFLDHDQEDANEVEVNIHTARARAS